MAGAPPPGWGWYRLDTTWAERLVADAGIRHGDLVVDIGAGDGALVAPLLAAGARVIAVELHSGRARRLTERFGTDITVVRTDARDLRLPRRPFRVVANPPWGITDLLLRRLLHRGSRLERADLLLKRSAANRAVRAHGPGRFDMSLGPTVPRRAFRPRPPIDGRVLIARRGRP